MSLHDPLSEVLRSIRLDAGFFCRSDFSAPFTVSAGDQPRGVFHALLEGPPCWVALEEGERVELLPGQVALLPHGHAHRLSHRPHKGPEERIEDLIARARGEGLTHLRTGGEGPLCRILCGSVTFARPTTHPLLAGLPPLIVSRAGDSQLSRWIADTLRTLEAELADPQPGVDAVLTRIADILVVQLLRSHLSAPEPAAPSWLSAMRDPPIRRALSRIHASPAEDWSVDSLADAAALSRSAFCERFTRLVGEPPGAYLLRWRMHLAAELLRREQASVAEAAEKVGYRSESAFSNAFLRAFGQRPAAYRRAAA